MSTRTLASYVSEASPERGGLDTIAKYLVDTKLSKNVNLLARNVESVKAWVTEVKDACRDTGGMAKKDVGLLLLACAAEVATLAAQGGAPGRRRLDRSRRCDVPADCPLDV